MTWSNYDSARDQIEAAGILLRNDGLVTGRMVRRKVTDSREERGWYILHELTLDDGDVVLVGSFGVWHGNDNGAQKISLAKRTLTADQKAAIAAQHKAAQAKEKSRREHEAARAAARAAAVWRKCAVAGTSDYLTRKGVRAHGLRYTDSGALVVPMCDPTGNVHGLQFILPSDHERRKKTGRDKEYWPVGLAKQGHFCLIGGLPKDVLLVAEGYATAATLFEATGYPVAVAFDAGNLQPVATVLAKTYRRAKILIGADDDYLTEGNPGVTKASAAALAVGGSHLAPVFAQARAGKKITDWNDLAAREGLQVVAAQVRAHLLALGWEGVAATGAGAAPSGGAGEVKAYGERRAAQSVMSLDDAIERFLPLDDGTGKYCFDSWTNKVVLRDQMAAVLPAGVRGDDVKRHPVWVSRGAYYLDQVGFDPSGKDPEVILNTWKGWPMRPVEGDCAKILELFSYLCSDSGEQSWDVYKYLLQWMAYPLQHPGAKLGSAVIMHGPQGTGKSSGWDVLATIYGRYSTTINQRALNDPFNSDWTDSTLFVLCEEVVAQSHIWDSKNELKDIVTGKKVRINTKMVAAYSQKNQMNFVFLSNEGKPLLLEEDDRRHLVIWTPPKKPESFYDELFMEIDNGGVAAFYHYLMALPLDDFHPKKSPPMTEAKRDLITLSLSSEDRFIQEWAEGETPYPLCPCRSMDLYTAYLKWCRVNGVARPRESNQFLGRVAKRGGWSLKLERVYESTHYTGQTKPAKIVIPELSALEAAGNAMPPANTKPEWLTNSMFNFKNSLGDGA